MGTVGAQKSDCIGLQGLIAKSGTRITMQLWKALEISLLGWLFDSTGSAQFRGGLMEAPQSVASRKAYALVGKARVNIGLVRLGNTILIIQKEKRWESKGYILWQSQE